MFCELEFYKVAVGKIILSANCGSTFKSEAATGMAASLKNLPQSQFTHRGLKCLRLYLTPAVHE